MGLLIIGLAELLILTKGADDRSSDTHNYFYIHYFFAPKVFCFHPPELVVKS